MNFEFPLNRNANRYIGLSMVLSLLLLVYIFFDTIWPFSNPEIGEQVIFLFWEVKKTKYIMFSMVIFNWFVITEIYLLFCYHRARKSNYKIIIDLQKNILTISNWLLRKKITLELDKIKDGFIDSDKYFEKYIIRSIGKRSDNITILNYYEFKNKSAFYDFAKTMDKILADRKENIVSQNN
jgi:hypothetical protein